VHKPWLAALAFGIACAGQAWAQDITIGLGGPMTGGESSFGRQMRNGAEQAVADINAAGGVLGQKLKLEIGDDACDAAQAKTVAEKFVALQVPFVAGHYCSSASIPASDIYAQGNVLQITPASTNPAFTERHLWNTFRVCGRDDQQGAVAGDYLAKNYKSKNIAVIHDNGVYGKGLVNEIKRALNRAGIKQLRYETAYNKGDKDFAALVAGLKSNSVDIAYVGGYHQEIGLLLRQMREQGLKTVLMTGDSLADKEFASIAGPAAEGALFTFGPDPRKRASAAAIMKTFKDKNIDPEGFTLYTYAAVQVWAQAVAKAGTIDPKKVAAIIRSGRWDTVLGRLSYTANGDITILDYEIYKWGRDGKYSDL
jgi:branched-chain amino acid transport system substrate-binding protein